MDLRRAFLLGCCFISVCGQFQAVNSSLKTVDAICKLAVPEIKFSLGKLIVEMQTNVLQDGEKAWIGYAKEFVTFEYIGCSNADRADMSYPLLSPNVGDCYFACKEYPVFGLKEYGRTCQCFHDDADWTLFDNTCVLCGDFLCGDKGHTALYKHKQVQGYIVDYGKSLDQCLSYTRWSGSGHRHQVYSWEECGNKNTVLCRHEIIHKDFDWGTSNSKCRYPYPYTAPYDGEWPVVEVYWRAWTANIRTVSVTKHKENTSPLTYELFGYVERVNGVHILKFTKDSSLTYLSVCDEDSILTTQGHRTTITTQSSVSSNTLTSSVTTKQSSISSSTLKSSVTTKQSSVSSSTAKSSVTTKQSPVSSSTAKSSVTTTQSSVSSSTAKSSVTTKQSSVPSSTAKSSVTTKQSSVPSTTLKSTVTAEQSSVSSSTLQASVSTKPCSVPSTTLKSSVTAEQSSVSSSTLSNILTFIPTTTQNSFTQHTHTMLNSPSPHTNTISPEAGDATTATIIVDDTSVFYDDDSTLPEPGFSSRFLYVAVAFAVLVIVGVFFTVFFIMKRRRRGEEKHTSPINTTNNITYDNQSLEIDCKTNQVTLCSNAESVTDNLSSFNSKDNDKAYSPDSSEYSYSSIDNVQKGEGFAKAKSIVASKSADENFYSILEETDDQISENTGLGNLVNDPKSEKYTSRNEYEHISLENDDRQSACYTARPNFRRCMDPALNTVYDHLNSTPETRHSNDNEDYDHTRAYSHAVFGNDDYDTTALAYHKGTKFGPGDDTAHYDTALMPHTDTADYYDHTSAFYRPVVDNTDYDTTAVALHKNTKFCPCDEIGLYDTTLTPQTEIADVCDLVEGTFGVVNDKDYDGTTHYQKRN